MNIKPTLADFTVDESFNYEALLDEAIETITAANAELGPAERQPDAALEAVVDPLRKLKESQAFFASGLTVQPVHLADFEARGLEPSHRVKKLMAEHDFYQIQAPVTLSPAMGWAFIRLECWVGFEADGAEIKIHDIHPRNVWTEILKLKTQLRLGLNEDLNFRASVEQSVYELLSVEAKALVDVEIAAGASLVVGPFDYQIRRPEVHAVGRENSEVFWRLDGREHVAYEEPYLAVVLRVPKDVKVVNAEGLMRAYVQFDFLGSHLKDWAGKFREKVASFLGKGIPLKAEASWPGVIVNDAG